jgi:hypothetical protein
VNIELTPSQQHASKKIDFFFKLGLSNLDSIEGISPRPIPLIAGPSGSGKTFIVGQVAKDYGIPLFCINVQNWIVRGSKNDAQVTIEQIREFVSHNERGVIFIDEVNKLQNSHIGSCAWSADVFSELLAFLDRDQRLEAMGLSGLTQKIKQQFLIVGAAAFQEQWQQSGATTPSIGFTEDARCLEDREDSYEQAIRSQDTIPEELLFRFNDRLILIAPPTQEEFGKRIVSLRAALSLSSLPEQEVQDLAKTAVKSQKCMRWIEGYLSECLTQLTPEAIASLSYSNQQYESSCDSSEPIRRTTPSPEERKKLTAEREAAWEKYETALGQLSLTARKLSLLLNSVLITKESGLLSPEQIHLYQSLCHVGEKLSQQQPSDEYAGTLARGLDYLAFHALKIPSNTISSKERAKYAKEIQGVSLKISEVLPELIAGSRGVEERREIREMALDFGVFTERAFVCLNEVNSINPNSLTRQES